MFYCVEDRDGGIAFCTQDPDSPDIQRTMDSWSYFDPQVKEYPEVWEVWHDIEDEDNATLISIHADPVSAILRLDSLTLDRTTIRKA